MIKTAVDLASDNTRHLNQLGSDQKLPSHESTERLLSETERRALRHIRQTQQLRIAILNSQNEFEEEYRRLRGRLRKDLVIWLEQGITDKDDSLIAKAAVVLTEKYGDVEKWPLFALPKRQKSEWPQRSEVQLPARDDQRLKNRALIQINQIRSSNAFQRLSPSSQAYFELQVNQTESGARLLELIKDLKSQLGVG